MTASSKPNPYSRFIPREEIGAVDSWHFSAMDEDGDSASAALLSETQEPSEERLDEIRQQAYNEGFAHGHATGGQEVREALELPLRQSAEETAVRMGELLHGMTDQLLASEQSISRQLLELACDLARQIVRQELTVNTSSLRPVIGEALELITDDGLPTTVRMNPQDLAVMQSALQETLGENAPEFVSDPAITPGGCVLQSASTSVDATIEKRWSRTIGNLGLSIEWAKDDIDV
jgi:flagellar assembly protein FliH